MIYEAVVTREGDSWLADVPEIPGAHTFARSLAGLYNSIREVIILMADLPDTASVEFRMRYDVADEAVTVAREVASERDELAERESVVQADTARIVHQLTQSGYSVRDTAHLVGITPGRVSQLTKTSR